MGGKASSLCQRKPRGFRWLDEGCCELGGHRWIRLSSDLGHLPLTGTVSSASVNSGLGGVPDLALGLLLSWWALTSGWVAGNHRLFNLVRAKGSLHLLFGQAGGWSHVPLDLITWEEKNVSWKFLELPSKQPAGRYTMRLGLTPGGENPSASGWSDEARPDIDGVGPEYRLCVFLMNPESSIFQPV